MKNRTNNLSKYMKIPPPNLDIGISLSPTSHSTASTATTIPEEKDIPQYHRPVVRSTA
jgi:hypothetical protein